MTKKVTITIHDYVRLKNESVVEPDDLLFPMGLVHLLIEKGFLVNPEPDCRVINVYIEGGNIVFEKECPKNV